MSDIGYFAAFLGGLLALLSPCGALLLPAFFAYAFGHPVRLLGRTAVFFLGLCLTLVPLGVAGSFASRLFYGHRDVVVTVGGWTVIVLGLAQLIGLGFGIGAQQLHRAATAVRSGSLVSVAALGAVYGLAGFCAGPILGAVLTVSAMGQDRWYGGTLLAVYALGTALPLFVLALCWDHFDLGRRRWLRGRVLAIGKLRLHTMSLLSGAMFILLGAVFLAFDGTSALPGLLSADQEFAVEEWASALGSAISDRMLLLFLAGAGALAGVILLVRAFRAPASVVTPEPSAAVPAPTEPAGDAPGR